MTEAIFTVCQNPWLQAVAPDPFIRTAQELAVCVLVSQHPSWSIRRCGEHLHLNVCVLLSYNPGLWGCACPRLIHPVRSVSTENCGEFLFSVRS